MRRYRLSSFAIDTQRNLLKSQSLPEQDNAKIKNQVLDWLSQSFGENMIEEKLERYLEFESPSFLIIVEYYQMMRQIEDSYIAGQYYPTLTAASSLGERIFNLLIKKIKDHHKDSPFYKKIHQKESIDNWNLAIEILSKWNVIQSQTIINFNKLKDLRHRSIHYEPIHDLRHRALSALRCIMSITKDLFGLRSDIIFWVPGEPYIQKDKEEMPIVREFYIPNCLLVGYKHTVNIDTKGLIFQDDFDYESTDISDDEFRLLREKQRNKMRENS